MRRLAVWFVDRIAATVGKSIDRAWDFFDFDDKDDDR